MALETATYISDLVSTNPAAGDPLSQADDHLRLIKSVLQSQFPDSGSGAIYGLRSLGTTATTSGSTIDITGIPSWAKRVSVVFGGVSMNNSAPIIVQLGTSGGVESSSYSAIAGQVLSSSPIAGSFSTGFGTAVSGFTASDALIGQMVLTLLDASSNTWVSSSICASQTSVIASHGAGIKALSGVLDRVRLTTVAGTATFDAGKVALLVE